MIPTARPGRARVVVAGSVNQDVVAVADRLPATGETVAASTVTLHPGGKGANQAVAAARAGAATELVGRVGTDAFAPGLRAFLDANGVDTSRLGSAEGSSGTAVVLVDAAGDNRIVVGAGANGLLRPDDVTAVPVGRGDVLVTQLEIPAATVKAFLAHGAAHGARTVLNAAPAHRVEPGALEATEVLVVNEVELATFAGAPVSVPANPADATDPAGEVAGAARAARARHDQAVVVTLGAAGVVVVEGEAVAAVAARPAAVVDTTGAGDCFVGYLAARLAAGDGLVDAAKVANRAAAIAVERAGAGPSMPTLAEVGEPA